MRKNSASQFSRSCRLDFVRESTSVDGFIHVYLPSTKLITESDTFNEKHWALGEAACHLGISKTTLKRLTLI